MNAAQPFFLTSPHEDEFPHERLERRSDDADLPDNTLDGSEDPAFLPDDLPIDVDDTEDSKPAMDVRLIVEEPEIPAGTIIESNKPRPGDEIDLPDEFIREEHNMPRLH